MRGDLRLLLVKVLKSDTTSFYYFSPMISHPTLGSGSKKTFKWYLKSEQTHRHTDAQTDRHTHIWTNRLIERIGPEGRCFENKLDPNKSQIKMAQLKQQTQHHNKAKTIKFNCKTNSTKKNNQTKITKKTSYQN